MPAGADRLYHALTGRNLAVLDLSVEPIARPIPDDLFVTDESRPHRTAPMDIPARAVSAAG
jgi:hypothetical protein